ncbi:Uncharacterised protein [Mycobacterium tuberculosis]|nr:Uncharacterised protein [Mycobacterium tuberculosis]
MTPPPAIVYAIENKPMMDDAQSAAAIEKTPTRTTHQRVSLT